MEGAGQERRWGGWNGGEGGGCQHGRGAAEAICCEEATRAGGGGRRRTVAAVPQQPGREESGERSRQSAPVLHRLPRALGLPHRRQAPEKSTRLVNERERQVRWGRSVWCMQGSVWCRGACGGGGFRMGAWRETSVDLDWPVTLQPKRDGHVVLSLGDKGHGE